jgi:hypothetical protein
MIFARTVSISMESSISILHLCKKLYYLYIEILRDLQLDVGIFFGIICFRSLFQLMSQGTIKSEGILMIQGTLIILERFAVTAKNQINRLSRM